MKKTISFVLCLFLYIPLGCSFEGPTRVDSLFPPTQEEIVADVLQLASHGPVHFRAKGEWRGQSNATFLLSWFKKGKIVFHVLSETGHDLYKVGKKITFGEFKRFLTSKGQRLSLNDLFVIQTNQELNYMDLKGGSPLTKLDVKFTLDGEENNISFKMLFAVASMNLSQYWDGNPNNSDDAQLYIYDIFRSEFSDWYLSQVQVARTQKLLWQIKMLGVPEIIAFQELESAKGRNELFKKGTWLRRELEALGYQSFLMGPQEASNPVALTTAVISRYSLELLPQVKVNMNDPFFNHLSARDKRSLGYTTRDVQVVEMDMLGHKTQIYVNHWRSKGCHSEASCFRSREMRLGNARIVKREIQKELKKNPDLDIVMLGDFNSRYVDEALELLGSTGVESVIQDAEENSFYNLWYELPVRKRWEVSFQGRHDELSHIMLGTGLYDNVGLQYIDNSFMVVGQSGPLSKILRNADGNPFRWQVAKEKVANLPEDLQIPLKRIAIERKCKSNFEGRKNPRCRISYTYNTGVGFSDHLPLVAFFHFVGKHYQEVTRTNFKPTGTRNLITSERPVINVEVDECGPIKSPKEHVFNIESIDLKDMKYFNKCVAFNSPNRPATLNTFGVYESAYFSVKGQKVMLMMSRAFDPRQISNGRPVGVERKVMHPDSDMCFTRKVFQGRGGKVARAFGRLGIMNGLPTIMISRRTHVDLVDLPLSKKKACKNIEQNP